MTVFYDRARQRWRYDFELNKVRYAKECIDATGAPVTSKRAATDAESEARRLARIGPKSPRASDLTLAQVMDRLTDDWIKEADWPNKQRYVREILTFFSPETLIRDIDEAKIADYLTFAQAQPIMIWTGGCNRRRDGEGADNCWKAHPSGKSRGPATVNRYLPVLRAVFDRAWKTRDPLSRDRAIEEVPVIADLKEPKRKARPAPEAVLTELEELLPDYTVEAIRTTSYFGFRKDEVFGLTVPMIDFDSNGVRLEADGVKDNEDVFLHASGDAMAWLTFLAGQAKARQTKYLITRPATITNKAGVKGSAWVPIKNPRTAFENAMDIIEKRHGKRWRWHDIRAAFITHVALKSGPLAAQKMARHSDFETTQAYIEVADQVMRDAAEAVATRPALAMVKGGRR